MGTLKRPLNKKDEIGLNLKASHHKSILEANTLCIENDIMERETQEKFRWVKEGKTMIRKKIVE